MDRAVNVTLLTLFVFATASGGLAFGLGAAPFGPSSWGARGSRLGLLVLVPAKARIARRGLRRPGRSRKVISWTLSVIVMVAIAGGLLHAMRGFAPVLGLLPMQIHVGAALAAAALLVAHVLPYRHRPPDRPRAAHGPARGRAAVGGLALWAVAPGRERRFTGSHEVSALPVTQWLFDPVLGDRPGGVAAAAARRRARPRRGGRAPARRCAR